MRARSGSSLGEALPSIGRLDSREARSVRAFHDASEAACLAPLAAPLEGLCYAHASDPWAADQVRAAACQGESGTP